TPGARRPLLARPGFCSYGGPSVSPCARGHSTAEGVGFEPTRDPKAPNGFRDRPVQPLRHPSGGEKEAIGVEWVPLRAPVSAAASAPWGSARGPGNRELLEGETGP